MKPHPTQAETGSLKAFSLSRQTFEELALPDLTIIQSLSLEGKGDTVHICGVLGFKSIAAMNTFLDT